MRLFCLFSAFIGILMFTGCAKEQPRFEFKHIHQNNFAVFDNKTGDLWISIPCMFLNSNEDKSLDEKVSKALFIDSLRSLDGSTVNYCLKKLSPETIQKDIKQ